ncbi:hypothetical protein ACGFWI_07670 [Streptomyces sp. NPDC048434]|uniref:hypothetical protein n=1 Tax=Streptomyces sp. NPDC048434 TaxID=3365549 RepID=UPI0037235ED3
MCTGCWKNFPEPNSRPACRAHTVLCQCTRPTVSRAPAEVREQPIKHPAGTRCYAAILQRTLTAAYKKADYFARSFRTIQVLIDRESILTGATHQVANSPGSTTPGASALLQ